jgi:hypothetical protein
MFANRLFTVFAVLALGVIIVFTLRQAAATTSIAQADRSYDQIEQIRSERSLHRYDAQYQFRLGEIALETQPVDAQYEFRLGEIALETQPIDPQYEFRRGEWFGQ